jgi:hypothetical protein
MLAICLAPAVAIHAGSASPSGARRRNARRGEGFEGDRIVYHAITTSTKPPSRLASRSNGNLANVDRAFRKPRRRNAAQDQMPDLIAPSIPLIAIKVAAVMVHAVDQ